MTDLLFTNACYSTSINGSRPRANRDTRQSKEAQTHFSDPELRVKAELQSRCVLCDL